MNAIDFTKISNKEKEFLTIVLQHRQITRKRLLDILDINKSTLHRMIDALVSTGVIYITKDLESASVGRPGDIIHINKQYGYFFSMCIRRFSYQVAILDFSFNIIESRSFMCDETSKESEIRENCYNSFLELLKKHNIKENHIIGIPIISFNSSKDHYSESFHHPGFSWINVEDIKEFFKEKFPPQIFFTNVALSAACSRYYTDYFPEYRNLAYIILDEGIGCGYIIDKKMARYSMRNVNALGHMIVDIYGSKCYCGQYGCLESIVNDFAIVKRTQDDLKIKKQGILYKNLDNLNIEDICIASKLKDPIACQQLDYAASILSIGIENFLRIFQLEVVIVTGKLFRGTSYFYDALKDKLQFKHPNLIVNIDDKEWQSALQGGAESYMYELLSLTPILDIN